MSKYIIEVGTSSIRVKNYQLGDSEQLERHFSVWNVAYHRYDKFGMSYDEDLETLYLPRGIDLYYVQGCLKVDTKDLIFLDPIEWDEFETVKMKYAPRDDLQKEALRFMLGLGEYKQNLDYSMLLVSSTTGFGKSYCAIYTMCYTKRKSIVITYSVALLQQWADYVFKYTNMKKDDVYLIKGSDSINMLLKQRTRFINSKIYLVTHATLRDYGNNYGWDKIDKLFRIMRVGNVYIDEAHREFDNICQINAHINCYKTYFITATPARSSDIENRIYQLSMKNVPSISLYNPDKDKHINYIAFKYSSCPSPKAKSDMYGLYGLDKNKYVNYVVNQPNFYKILRVCMNMVMKANGPCIFYIDTNNAIQIVYRWLCENYPEFAGDIGIFSGLVDNDTKVKEKYKRLILTTMKSGSTGENIDGLKMAFVLAAPFKSTVTAIQCAGRLRDPNTYFIELVDLSFQTLKRFYYYKLPTYNERMLTVQDVNFNQYKLDEKASDLEFEMAKRNARVPFTPVDPKFGVYINPIHQYGKDEKINPIKQF